GAIAAVTLIASLAGIGAAAPPKPDSAAAAGPQPPKEREYSYLYDVLDQSIVRPVTRALDVPAIGRKLTGHRREAFNVDENDQVRLPSTWWQPRLGFRTVTVEQMLAGPGTGKGPVPGRWKLTSAKTQGVTPGFNMKDANGDKFVIKFDPPGYPDLGSGADVIGCYLFWAAGYNVPDNAVAYLYPDSLDIDDKATYKDALGKEKPFKRELLE